MITLIDRVLKDWKVMKLKDVCTKIKAGGTPLTSRKEYYNGEIPFVKIEDVTNSKKFLRFAANSITKSGLENSSTWVVPPYSILFAMYGSIGAIAINEAPVSTNQAILGIVPRKEVANVEFLYYLLSYLKPHFEKYAKQTTQANLTAKIVKNFKISLPPLREQRRIAEVLSSVDYAIQSVDEAIAKTERLKKGLIHKLLTEGIGHKEFKTTKIGRLPATWEVTKLRHLIEKGIITYHLDGNHGVLYPREEEFVDQGVPFLSANMLVDGTIDFTKAKYVTEERAKQFRKGIAKDGDVLFAHNATVGPVGILSTNLPFVIVGTSLTCYRCNPDHLHNYYLKYFMESVYFQKQYRPIMKQSTRNQVPITAQREFRFIIPPVNEQKKIADILSTVEHKLRLEKKRKHKLERIKRGLMNVLLTGKRRVKVAM